MFDETMTLADLRRKAGLSQRQVAEAMGRSESTVNRMETAYPDVSYSRLREYLRAIGRDVKLTGATEDDDLWADNVISDPSRSGAREARRTDPSRGGQIVGAKS